METTIQLISPYSFLFFSLIVSLLALANIFSFVAKKVFNSSHVRFEKYQQEAEEIIKILVTIVKKSKINL